MVSCRLRQLPRLSRGALAAAGMAALLLVAGCPRPSRRPAGRSSEVRPEPGSRDDAVLREPVEVEETADRASYAADGWRFSVGTEAGWRRQPDQTSTLKLVREAQGVPVALRVRVYAIRKGMEPRTFLAAHAMWIAEENGPRIEYTWDEDLQAWQGYAVSREREAYYLFKVAGGRAYVLEEAAESGALGAAAADEFQRIAADFRCSAGSDQPRAQ
jgi:hypothetical protein